MGRTARFIRLSSSDRLLLVEAGLAILAFQTMTRLVPFSSTRRIVSHLTKRRGRLRVEAKRIGWAVGAASRVVGVSNCLSMALAAHVLLLRAGHESTIRVGVARGAAGSLIAHAWVVSGDSIIVGGDELDDYVATSGSGMIA